jgi:hypothetical protein
MVLLEALEFELLLKELVEVIRFRESSSSRIDLKIRQSFLTSSLPILLFNVCRIYI